jgi:hypothetical protein
VKRHREAQVAYEQRRTAEALALSSQVDELRRLVRLSVNEQAAAPLNSPTFETSKYSSKAETRRARAEFKRKHLVWLGAERDRLQDLLYSQQTLGENNPFDIDDFLGNLVSEETGREAISDGG